MLEGFQITNTQTKITVRYGKPHPIDCEHIFNQRGFLASPRKYFHLTKMIIISRAQENWSMGFKLKQYSRVLCDANGGDAFKNLQGQWDGVVAKL
jgi:hypothetical protein